MLDFFTAIVFALVLLEIMAGVMLVGWLVQVRHRNGFIGWALAHAGAAAVLVFAWFYDEDLLASLFGSAATVLGLTLLALIPGTVYLLFRLLRAEEQTYGAYRRDAASRFLATLDPVRVQRLEHDFKLAVQAPDKHFTILYQPIFFLSSREVAGFEALLRWRHPSMGDIPPDEFIALAEKTGLIIPLGNWVLETASRFAAEMPKRWTMSVNVSPVQLMRRQFVRQVADILAITGLAPERLQLEVTEGVMIDVRNRARQLLTDVASMGVRIAVDDFGTGYAHLRYLNRMPCHVIKIDRSFVSDLVHDPAARRVTAALVGLAHDLGHDVVAEGVETEEQMAALAELGCEKVQGYLLARPMEASDIIKTYVGETFYRSGEPPADAQTLADVALVDAPETLPDGATPFSEPEVAEAASAPSPTPADVGGPAQDPPVTPVVAA